MAEVEQVERMMSLFRGNRRAHGIYIETPEKDPLKPKVKGKAMTASTPPTLAKWTAHLKGEQGLGIIPINEESKCYWGALDIDGKVDHKKLLEKVEALGLPLTICYSKSRSAHCFLFLENQVEAGSIRSILEEMASKLGVAGCEIFPKQDTLNLEKGDFGNWLNMPYYHEDQRRCIVLSNGEIRELTFAEFLDYATSRRLSEDKWRAMIGKIQKNLEDLNSVLDGAPPCIQYILKTQGIAEGNRNKLMYNIAVYCKKKYGEEQWRDEVKNIHDKYASEPLSIKELDNIIKSVEGKDYRYQCKDSMLKQFCNSSLCVDRDNGIDFSTEIKQLKNATRILTDPNIFAVEVEMDGERPAKVYVSIDELFRQDLFRKACAEQLHKTFVPMSVKTWNELSTNIVNKAINQDPPFDMLPGVQIYLALTDYLRNRAQTDPTVMVNEEGVFLNPNTQLVYFKINGFRNFLVRRGSYGKDLSTIALGKKLQDIEIPTDEIDIEQGTCTKRKIEIGNRQLRIGRKSEYLRTISADEIDLSVDLQKAYEGLTDG